MIKFICKAFMAGLAIFLTVLFFDEVTKHPEKYVQVKEKTIECITNEPCVWAKTFPGEKHTCVHTTQEGVDLLWQVIVIFFTIALIPIIIVTPPEVKIISCFALVVFVGTIVGVIGFQIALSQIQSSEKKAVELSSRFEGAKDKINECFNAAKNKAGEINIKTLNKELKKLNKQLEKDLNIADKAKKYASNAKNKIKVETLDEKTKVLENTKGYNEAYQKVVEELKDTSSPLRKAYDECSSEVEKGLLLNKAIEEYLK